MMSDLRMDYAIYACDVGSPSRRFAWARVASDRRTGFVVSPHLDHLVDAIAGDLAGGRAVALGFECPLSIPLPARSADLSKARPFDAERAWSASFGAPGMVGLQQATWIFTRLRERLPSGFAFGAEWPPASPGPALVCWEAFVAGSARAACETHAGKRSETCAACAALDCRDAVTAADAFLAYAEGLFASEEAAGEGWLSIAGAAAIRSGIATDPRVLSQPPMALRPKAHCTAPVLSCDPDCRRRCSAAWRARS